MFFRLSLTATIALCGLAAHAQSQPQSRANVPDDAPVVQAGTASITKREFERMLSGDPRLALAQGSPQGMQALGTEFGRAFALEAEARQRKLDQDPGVQLKVRNYTQQLLAAELVSSVRHELLREDKVLRAAYEANKDEWSHPRVRQILVRFKGSQVPVRAGRRDLTVDQARVRAQSLLGKLQQGADFAKLATAESDDGGSLRTGGDIGFVPKGSMAAAFEAAAYSLPTGQVSGLVQTEFGFHILRVEERQPIPFDTIKNAIANGLAHAQLDRLILDGYKLNTAYFGGN